VLWGSSVITDNLMNLKTKYTFKAKYRILKGATKAMLLCQPRDNIIEKYTSRESFCDIMAVESYVYK